MALQAVAFGMGGGLLQKVNRDTMQFATKLSHIVYADGSVREVAKMPKTDPAKASCSFCVACMPAAHSLLAALSPALGVSVSDIQCPCFYRAASPRLVFL